jgi:hypothetical protein
MGLFTTHIRYNQKSNNYDLVGINPLIMFTLSDIETDKLEILSTVRVNGHKQTRTRHYHC